ncbi:MAG: CBS domain-containing protein [Rhodocyclaceae bacterium]|jgi:CBS domain-containing protein
MFSVFGVGGLTYQGRLEELPGIRPVPRTQPVVPIGTDGAELREAAGSDSAAIAAYRKMLRVDQERGPLIHARQLMRTKVVVVASNDDVARAWRTLVANQIHQAPVLDTRQQLVGIVSERDLLTSINIDHDEVRDALARRVADVMTSPVVAADPLTDIRRIARAMLDHDVDGVPIVDASETLVGFVSRGDVLRAVVTDPPLSLWR